jgi:rhamnosyltransferase
MNDKIKICGLIVVFNPNIDSLKKVLCSLSVNVEKIFIFDNTDDYSAVKEFNFNYHIPIEILANFKNIGIGAAQNIILNAAIRENFNFAVMSDQDTYFPIDYVFKLSSYCNVFNNIAAIFPGWLDLNLQGDAKYPGQFVIDPSNKMLIDFTEPEFLKISHGISSGMMINLSSIQKIGLMNDKLFIDWVDNEWCWRARSAGFVLLAIPSVKIQHTLGDSTVNILGKKFVKRRLERNYYIIRNALYLIFYTRINSAAKIYLVKKTFHHTIFSFIASSDKFSEISILAKAWLHGFQARLGKID